MIGVYLIERNQNFPFKVFRLYGLPTILLLKSKLPELIVFKKVRDKKWLFKIKGIVSHCSPILDNLEFFQKGHSNNT